jgi:Zn-dependent peptidase ImmA (M78 family)
VDDGATAEEREGVRGAMSLWNTVAKTQLQSQGAAGDGSPSLAIHFELGSPAFYGVYHDAEPAIVINRYVTDPERRTVIIAHEIGHAFGLHHVHPTPDAPSVMQPGNQSTPPSASDVTSLRALWADCQ